MRPGLIRVIVGVLLLAAGFVAPMLYPGIQWWGAFLLGAYYIIRGGYMMAQASRQQG
jgi:hypothetical protein